MVARHVAAIIHRNTHYVNDCRDRKSGKWKLPATLLRDLFHDCSTPPACGSLRLCRRRSRDCSSCAPTVHGCNPCSFPWAWMSAGAGGRPLPRLRQRSGRNPIQFWPWSSRRCPPPASPFPFPALAGGRQPPPRAREELHALFQRLAARPVSRAALSGSLAAARSELTDKYIPQAFERRKYIAVEVSRVQRLSLSAPDLADLLRFALMLRPAAYLSITPDDTPEKDAGFAPLQGPYVQKVLAGVSGLLPSFPSSLIGMGLHSALAFPAAASLEAVSRLAAILALRGRALTACPRRGQGCRFPRQELVRM